MRSSIFLRFGKAPLSSPLSAFFSYSAILPLQNSSTLVNLFRFLIYQVPPISGCNPLNLKKIFGQGGKVLNSIFGAGV